MVGKIASFRFSKRFKKDYKKIPVSIQNNFKSKLTLLLTDMQHPSLRVKRIQGTKSRWEGSITRKYRFTFEFDEETLVFRGIGTHDILGKTD